MDSGDTRSYRVLFLIRSLDLGGAERQLVALAVGLHERGWDVQVVTFYSGGALRPHLEKAGISVWSLEKKSRWDVFGFLWRLWRCIKENRPDILHSYLGSSNILAVATRLLRPGMPIVWGVRASNMDLCRYGWLDRLLFRLECFLSRFPDLIVVNSEVGRAYVNSHGFPVQKSMVIHNGIDTGKFRPDAGSRVAMRKRWNVDDGNVVIGRVGRFDPMKDYETFIKAAAILARRHGNVRFVCIGGGAAEYQGRLKRLAEELDVSEQITWLDATLDMEPIYRALDIVASTSAFGEGFPNIVGEAMASGVPCVVTDVGDSALVAGDTGIVVPPHDPVAFAKGLSTLIDMDSNARSELGRRARQHVLEQFSKDIMVKRTGDAIAALLQGTAG